VIWETGTAVGLVDASENETVERAGGAELRGTEPETGVEAAGIEEGIPVALVPAGAALLGGAWRG